MGGRADEGGGGGALLGWTGGAVLAAAAVAGNACETLTMSMMQSDKTYTTTNVQKNTQ